MSLENICRNRTTILAQHEGKNTRINVNTTCEKIKKWGNEFNLPKIDLMDKDVAFDLLNKKREMCSICSNCYVPPTVMSAYWIENEKISKDVACGYKGVDIKFEEIK